MFVVMLLVILVIFLLVKYILEMHHNESYVGNLKCKQPFVPFFGNVFSILGLTSSEVFNEFIRFATQNETPLKMYMGSRLIVILDKPEDLKAILLSPNCFDKPYIYGFYPCPQGIATEQNGVLWRRSRKIVNPLFHMKTIQSFIPMFNKKIAIVVNELKGHVGKSNVDIIEHTYACSLDTICATLFGLDMDLKANGGREFIESYKEMSRIIVKRAVRPWAHFDFIYQSTSLYKQQQNRMADIWHLRDRVFEEQVKNYWAKGNNESGHNDDTMTVRNENPFIGPYIEGKFSEDVLKQQIDSILIAAFDSTGSTIAYAILMLAVHPKVQEQVFDELHSVFDAQDEDTTFEHMQKMHLLDRVIKETMRLFPFGPFIERVSTAEVAISNCILPKNTNISLSIFTLHRRKDIWGEHSNDFNPDNFLPEKVQSRHPCAFLPFSNGARNCVGYQYAMFAMKVMLSALLRNYQFSTDSNLSDLEFKFELTLNLVKNPMVKISKRNW